jgi:polyisoprenoid-binding protein YceI
MSQAEGVHALVRTGDGWAVQHAVLTVTDLSGNQVARSGADQDGMVSTDALPTGTYTAILTAAGYAPVARTAMVTASGSAPLGTITLNRVGGAELPPPGKWTIDPAHSSINVTARHLGMSSVRGRFDDFAGTLEIAHPVERSSVTAVIQSASIDTNQKMRDDHLRSKDFLDVEHNPVITYRSTGLAQLSEERWALDGELTLNGVTRPVQLDLTYLGTGPDAWGGTRAAFHAVTELHRDDFAITYNQVLRAGIGAIGATLRVEIDIQAVQGESLPGM